MLLASNFVHYAVLTTIYTNILCVIFGLILFPVSIVLALIWSNNDFFLKSVNFTAKISGLLFYFLLFLYASGFCVLILSVFLESINFIDAISLVIQQWIFFTIIWGASILAYTILVILLLPFGISLMSVSQIKQQLSKY